MDVRTEIAQEVNVYYNIAEEVNDKMQKISGVMLQILKCMKVQ